MRDLGRLEKRVMKIVRKYVQHFFSREVDELCVRGSRTVVHEENITNKRIGPTPTAENVFATSPQRASLFTELAACGNFDWQL